MTQKNLAAVLLVGTLAGAAVWWWRNREQGGAVGEVGFFEGAVSWLEEAAEDLDQGIFQYVGVSIMGADWIKDLNTRGAAYRSLLLEAEQRNGIPAGMLARLAWQESRFRPDIISGKTVSSAGALGIMQIVPKWHPGVDPLNPQAAIDYAARYLASLHAQFGNWEHALQAYNWGPGNLKAYLAGKKSFIPRETANYSRQILADLGTAGGVA
jgi:soluble lytic murein transglycosylase-like protein